MINNSTTNGTGLTITGNGSASAISAIGGSTGNGITVSGGATSGHGIQFTGTGTGKDAINATGGNSGGHGLSLTGGNSGSALFAAGGSNSNGIECFGDGVSDGFAATGGATGRGIHALGGITSGAGARFEARAGNSPGFHAVGFLAGCGMLLDAGATGDGFKAATTAGVPFRADITGNLTGTVLALDSAERTAIADAVETAIVNGTDTAAVNAAIASAVWKDATAGDFTIASSMGKKLSDWSPTADTSGVTTLLGRIPGAITLSGGKVQLDLTQAVPTSNTAQTVGDALNAARAQGFGKWVISGTALTLYAADGSTVVKTFTLNSATAPTSRQ